MVAPLQIVTPGQTRTRKRREPQFPLAGTMKPYGLYPLFASPVLPGETLSSAELKYRVISMPIRHPLVGAWLETWLVYVSLTDIDNGLAEMFIKEDVATTGFTAPAERPRFFTPSGKIDYLKLATDRVISAYFRDEGETGDRRIDTVPLLRRANWDWAQNLMFRPDELDPSLLPSALPEDGTYTPLEIMRMAGMSEITYERYLTQYGVSKKQAMKEAREPEILRYTRSWTLPTNTIDPGTGRPSSAWAWSETLKAEKAKRFDEPGFLIWFGAIKPKLYDKSFSGSLISSLWGFADWFPVYNLDDPAGGIKELEAGFVTNSSGETLLYDHRDLLSHGEAFVNNWDGPYRLPQMAARNITSESLSVQDVRHHYPTEADINALFSESDQETPDPKRQTVYYEGIGSLQITGHVVDTTK